MPQLINNSDFFNSQLVFCTAFLLKIPFILRFYITFSTIICCTKSKIPLFIIPKLILQSQHSFSIYKPLKCVYKKSRVQLRYLWHLIENFHGALLLFLVDDSDGSNHHCF